MAAAVLLSCGVLAGMERFVKKNAWPAAGAFRDVSVKSWYLTDVRACYELGLFSGRGSGVFDPSGAVTVAEAVTLAARLGNIYRGGPGVFDQSCTPWYDTTVKIAISMKIITKADFTDADFKRAATRAELAYIFAHALPSTEYKELNRVETLPDVAASDKYASSIFTLYNAGILKGSDDYGTFRPADAVKRAEAAAMVRRIAQPSQRLTFTLKSSVLFDEIVSAGDAAFFTVGKNGKYGYMKRDGSALLCPLAYDFAFTFRDGKGVVVTTRSGIDGTLHEFGYIDDTGAYHALHIITADSWTPGIFWGGYLRVDTEYASGDTEYRLFDASGTELTFFSPGEAVRRHIMSGVSDGLVLVDDDAGTPDWRSLSYVDVTGKTVLRLPDWENLPGGTGKAVINAGSFDRGYAPVLEGVFQNGVLKSSLWGIIDKTGAYVLAPQFDTIFFGGDSAEFRLFGETGYATALLADGVTYAILHKSGMVLPLAGYNGVGLPPDSGTLVSVQKGGLYGYVDAATGKLVIPCKYESADPFAGGLAVVSIGGLYGLLAPDGTLRYEAKYTEIVQGVRDAWLLSADGAWTYVQW